MDEKTSLSLRSEALRTFAAAMLMAINKFTESNEKLIAVFNSVRDDIGPRCDDILDVINSTQKTLEESSEPIAFMQQRLEEKADEIDAYIAAHFGGGQNP